MNIQTQNSMRLQFKRSKEKKSKKKIESNFANGTQEIKQQQKKESQLFNVFSKFLDKNRQKRIRNSFIKYVGKNYPVDYKDNYNFEEQWQNKMFYEFKKLKSLINQDNYLELTILLLTTITYSLTIWFSTVNFYFAKQTKLCYTKQLSCLTLAIHLLRILLKVKHQLYGQRKQNTLFSLIKSYKGDIIIFLYLIIKICQTSIEINRHKIFFAFQSISIIIMYFSARKVYQSLRYMNFSLRYQYHTKIFDMIMTIFIVAHIIVYKMLIKSIALIEITKVNPDSNWMTHLNIQRNDFSAKYIYTYYFTITTILTVGYGDITPKNPQEILMVIVVEIFGIVIFGYVINQIGYCISALKKNRQVIDKDLATIQKIKQQYKMDSIGVNKMVSFVINNKEMNDKLTPQEEKNVFLKLNDEIRSDIMKENYCNIVKNSIFFLCRWSKYFQNNIALKLNHALYNPNDILSQIKNKEKIYLIKQGKINIHADRSEGKKRMGMVLKTIQNSKNNQIFDNCYGYTAVISERPFNLYAVSKDFTSAYYIEKADFIQCAKQKVNDFEYYHEIKAKLDQSALSQTFQVDILESNRHHYNPSKTFLLKKFNKTKMSNKRRSFNRSEKSLPKGNYYYQTELATKIRDVFISSTKQLQRSDSDENDKQITSMKQFVSIDDEINPTKSSLILYDLLLNKKQNFQTHFQSSKQYQNYFSSKNITNILKKYENQYFTN